MGVYERSAYRGQKKILDPPELELQAITERGCWASRRLGGEQRKRRRGGRWMQ